MYLLKSPVNSEELFASDEANNHQGEKMTFEILYTPTVKKHLEYWQKRNTRQVDKIGGNKKIFIIQVKYHY